MQQIFPSTPEGDEGRPLISFPLPEGALVFVSPRKRSRSPDARTRTAVETVLSPSERRTLFGFMKYGDQALSPINFFICRNQCGSALRDLPLTPAGTLSRSSIPPQYQGYSTALRQSLSLLCRVMSLDSAAHFLRAPPTVAELKLVAPHGETGSVATGNPTGAPGPSSNGGTLELYCRVQALELEFEDVMLLRQAFARMDSAPEALQQQVSADLKSIVQCVESAVNTLEATILKLFLSTKDLPAASATVKGNGKTQHKASSAAATVEAEYLGRIIEALPSVFQSEQWPAQVICDRSESMASAVAASASLYPLSAALLSTDSIRVMVTANGIAAPMTFSATYQGEVGGAVTSLALNSLLDLCTVDVCDVLGMATASPLSRLAALERLREGPTAAAESNASRHARTPLALEQITFQGILVRAWNHNYGLMGLRRLQLEMDTLFLQYTARAMDHAGAKTSPTVAAVRCLREQWHTILQRHCNTFVQKILLKAPEKGSAAEKEREEQAEKEKASALRVEEEDSFTLLRQHATAAEALTEVQMSALRVIEKLQRVDSNGWFAVPAFDLVNVDFQSVRHWITSASFVHKSKRDAYRSLCHVLERMVDSCVQKYGPTHAFSEVITSVRQQLVDVARAERLL